MAGTSAKGCCPKCGAPWERIVSDGLTSHDGQTQSQYPKGSTANRLALLRQAARERGEEYTSQRRTLDWKPACQCFCIEDTPDPAPCTVLDPFAGSFTTCKVSLELGRKAIGIELNPEYIKLGRDRCNVTPGLALA